MNPILECQHLSKKYQNNFYALNDLTLTLDCGQIVGLLGPNGSGKTTLIKLVNDLLVPSVGSVRVNGHAPCVETKNLISYLPERTYLDDSMKVKDIISYFSDFYDNFRIERAMQMLSDLQIDSNAHLKTFSKGTKEKLQLVLVMSRDAKLYILDEPIGGVDPAAREYILNTIISNYREDATILLSTHLIKEVEHILDRVLFIRQGHLIMNSSVDEIRTEHGKSVDALFKEEFRC